MANNCKLLCHILPPDSCLPNSSSFVCTGSRLESFPNMLWPLYKRSRAPCSVLFLSHKNARMHYLQLAGLRTHVNTSECKSLPYRMIIGLKVLCIPTWLEWCNDQGDHLRLFVASVLGQVFLMKRKRKHFIVSKDEQYKVNFLLWIIRSTWASFKTKSCTRFKQLLLSACKSHKRIHVEVKLKAILIDNPIDFAKGGGTAFPTCDWDLGKGSSDPDENKDEFFFRIKRWSWLTCRYFVFAVFP